MGAGAARGDKDHGKDTGGQYREMAAVPYIPALWNVAEHAARLRAEQVDGVMLGWTLGGYPSPNLGVVALMMKDRNIGPKDALEWVSSVRYGVAGTAVMKAWGTFSKAFSEFPFGGDCIFRLCKWGRRISYGTRLQGTRLRWWAFHMTT